MIVQAMFLIAAVSLFCTGHWIGALFCVGAALVLEFQ